MNRYLLLILGPGRSGTSVLTKVLSMVGCTLPAALYGADEGNPTGYWEPKEVLKLNRGFLRNHGSALGDPRLILSDGDGSSVSGKEFEDCVEQVACFLRNCGAGRILVVKDPQITELIEVWLSAAQRLDLKPVVIISIRNPNEFIESATGRVSALGIDSSEEWMAAFWLKYNLLAERCTRKVRRTVVDYANFMSNWRREICRISADLGLEFGKYDEAQIDAFVSRDLYRAKSSGAIRDPFCMAWLQRAYSVLSGAAAGRPIEENALESIFEEYSSCERAFRIAFSQFDASLSHPGRNREVKTTVVI